MEGSLKLLNVLKARRSIRRFKSDAVPKECVEVILEAARWSPSAGNRQPWRFIVVTHAITREKIGEIYQNIRKAELYIIPKDTPYYKALDERIKADFYKRIFSTAPCAIVVCANKAESFRERTYVLDCAAAIQNMLLMAYSLGLGSIYINFDRPEHEQELRQLKDSLEVPDNITIQAVLPLGYPDEKPSPPPRKDPCEIVYQEKFGLKTE